MKAPIKPLHRMVIIALLSALALVVMAAFNVPLIPAAPFLKYEPSGAIIFLCAMLLGPRASIQCALIKAVLYFFVGGGDFFGVTTDFLATIALTVPASYLVHRYEVIRIRQIALCGLVGCICAILLMIPTNYVILGLQFQMSTEAVTASLVYSIPFNIFKTISNNILMLLLLIPLRKAMTKTVASGMK